MSFCDFVMVIAIMVFAWFMGIGATLWVFKRKAPDVYRDMKKAMNDEKEGHP